jgi:phytoene dehydrogenase-like protein
MSGHWDAIVIGSGLGGLTAGALYARHGRRVLVLEQHDRCGGAATVFRRGPLLVEVGLHQMDGLDGADFKRQLFRRLGLEKRVEFIPLPEFYAIRHASLGGEFVMPVGLEAGQAAAIERFPRHARAIRYYFEVLARLRAYSQTIIASYHNRAWRLVNIPLFPLRFFSMVWWMRTNLGQFLDDLFGNDESVKIALCANLGYYADDPDGLSLLYFALAQGSYHIGGGHYIRGGSQNLSDALVGVIREAGGEARTGRAVTRILTRGRQVHGVVHEAALTGGDAWEEEVPLIFGNAAPAVLAGMLEPVEGERFFRPYRDIPLSTSLWTVYLGLNRPPSQFGVRAHNTFFMPTWMASLRQLREESTLMADDPKDRTPFFVLVDYSGLDAGLAPEGQYLAVLCGLDRFTNWEDLDPQSYRTRKAAWLKHLVAALDREFPGIASAIVYSEMATAKTIHRYLNTPGGTTSGFAPSPSVAGLMRPHSHTSVGGLYLASAFAPPGGGFTGVILAGYNAYCAAGGDDLYHI